MEALLRLNALPAGQTGTVLTVEGQGPLTRRLQELGLTRGAAVRCLDRRRSGRAGCYDVRGTVLALRRSDCRGVWLECDA